MRTGKITLTKETRINNEIRYFVYDENGWCLGNSLQYEKMKELYEICLKNKANGLPREDILEQG